ncbi:MAG: insulinase family protein [Comamonadaceae bacterium]|nr:insulinase family protein [Comamonadaceae bacterium]
MSSPLLDRVRERRGLVYHADCSADVTELCGQFVIEASTGPEHLDEYFAEVTRRCCEHVDATDPVDLDRARNQIVVRSLLRAGSAPRSGWRPRRSTSSPWVACARATN